ncbi:hypothetical protein FXW78_11870 [Rhodococcus opacus]|nr:hypothetical protein [Rhodococcus opacus]
MHLISSDEGRRHLVGGHWLVFLLLGLLTVSAIGEYGPLSTPWLVFPADSLSAVVVGLIAFYWVRHRLPHPRHRRPAPATDRPRCRRRAHTHRSVISADVKQAGLENNPTLPSVRLQTPT